MKSSGLGSLIAIVLLAGGLLAATLITGNKPLLGLDLQGGVEVVLRPNDNPENLALVTPENLESASEILRKRVDAIGVAEPDITVQGDNIIVQLPGIDDQARAIELVGQTAELRFRPLLLQPVPISQLDQARSAFDGVLSDSTTVNDSDGGASVDAEPADAGESDEGEDENGLGALVPGGESASLFQDAEGDDVDPLDSPLDSVEVPNPNAVTLRDIPGVNGGASIDDLLNGRVTAAEDDNADQSVVLSDGANLYLLGPTNFTGRALTGAAAQTQGVNQWYVRIDFKEGAEGTDLLNEFASACFYGTEICPAGQTAVVLDSKVESANGYETPTFDTNSVILQRGSLGFTEEEAKDTALVLDFGALPLVFDDPAEAGLVRSVSATLGRDSLNAGLVAGAVGVAIVGLYMLFYYRLLGLAAVLSLLISGSLLWVVVSWLSSSQGLALTLAGVVGLIVSIGVSLDSNVVYFEHMKEEIKSGRTFRSAIDGSFPAAFQTVFWANMATLIGALILYFLTVGSVKGFALMLGIASVLDLIATYFFMRPFVHFLGTRKGLEDKPRRFGMPTREAVDAALEVAR